MSEVNVAAILYPKPDKVDEVSHQVACDLHPDLSFLTNDRSSP